MDVFLSYKDLIKQTSAEIEKLRNSNIPIGLIVPYGGNTIPSGWLECNGMAVNRVVYAQLFSVIGTIYGEGDGSTTFNLPNISGKTLVGRDTNDTSFDTLGETGGEKTHTLTTAEMPSHNHGGSIGSNRSSLAYQGMGYTSSGNPWVLVTSDSTHSGWANSTEVAYHSHTLSISATGDGGAHNNMPPYLVTRYIIKAVSNPEDTPVSPTIEQRIAALEAQMSVDTIVSQGTSGIWTWRKWSSGIAECWGRYSKTDTNYTTFSGFAGYKIENIAYPSNLFISVQDVQFTVGIGSGFTVPAKTSGSNYYKTTSFDGLALSSATGSKLQKWDIHVTGKWK